MKKLAFLLALLALTSAHAATPTAVWEGNDLTDGNAKNGMTLRLNGNTSANGVVTISSLPVYIETGMTSSSPHAGTEATVVVTWENVPSTFAGVVTFSTSARQDVVGIEDYYGNLYGSKDGSWSSASWPAFAEYPKDLASHKIAVSYAGPSDGSGSGGYTGCTYVRDGGNVYAKDTLYYAGYVISRINVGSYQGGSALTGARITRIAVYNSALSTEDLAKATGEDEPEPEEEVVWGNVGNESTAGVATTVNNSVSFSSFTVDFGATDNISQTAIGNDGSVKITKVRLFADNNASAKPSAITISQGDVEVTSDPCSFVASQKIYGNQWPSNTKHYWTRKAIDATFTSETQFDTTKPITISFDETTICGIQPVNSVCVGSSYTPAIEITGDYTEEILPDTPTYTWNKFCENTAYTAMPLEKAVTAGKQIKLAFKGAFAESDLHGAQILFYSGDSNDIYLTTDSDGHVVLTLNRKTSQDVYADKSDTVLTAGAHQFGMLVRRGANGSGHTVSIIVTMDGKELVRLGDGSLTFDTNPMRRIYFGDSAKADNSYTAYYVEPENGVDDDVNTVATLVTDVKVLFKDGPQPEPTEVLDPMYLNRLSMGGEVIEAGDYGNITVPGNGFKATALTGKMTLPTSGDDVSGDFSGIFCNGVNIQSHTVAGWFKVDELPSSGNKLLWSVRNDQGSYGGYTVVVDSEGKVVLGRTSGNADADTPSIGNSVTTPSAVITPGEWCHLAIAFKNNAADGGTSKTVNRNATVTLFKNGGEAIAMSKLDPIGCNGGTTTQKFYLGASGIFASGIYVDTAALTTTAAVVEAALTTPVAVGTPTGPVIEKDEDNHTWMVDTTYGAHEFTSAEITELKNTAWKVTLKSQSELSATINFGSISGPQPSHFVIESGMHAMTWVNGNKDTNFNTTGTESDPSILVKSGATLNFTARDITGWEGAATNKTGNVIRVNDGGALNLVQSSTSTHYYQGRYYLDPGATLTATYSGNAFRLNGGAVEGSEQLYVPDTTNGAPVATISAANGLRLAADTTPGLGVFVGTNATLEVDANITSDGARPLTKWGAGTLALNGSLTGYSGALTINAGTLKLPQGASMAGGLAMAAGTVLDVAYDGLPPEGTALFMATAGITMGDDAVVKVNGEECVYSVVDNAIVFGHAEVVVPEKNLTYEPKVGASPSGWFSSFNGEPFTAVGQFRVGPGGECFSVVSSGQHPYNGLEGKSNYTMALYADISQMAYDKTGRYMLDLGNKNNGINQGLLMTQNGNVQLYQANKTTVQYTLTTTNPPAAGYHLFVWTQSTANGGALYIDGVRVGTIPEMTSATSAGFQIGNMHGGVWNSNYSQGIGMAVAAVYGWGQVLSPAQVALLAEQYPPVLGGIEATSVPQGITGTLNLVNGNAITSGVYTCSIAVAYGATVDIAYDGEVVEGAQILSASSISADNATFTINGDPLPPGLDMDTSDGRLVIGKQKVTKLLNPLAVKEGDALKVSCNAEAAEGEAAKAYDGNLATYFAPGSAANALGVSWTGIEFTNGVIVTRIAYVSNKEKRVIGGAFQGANQPDFSDAENMHVVVEYTSGGVDVTLDEAKGPYKYLRFIGMYGGDIKEIAFYGLADSGALAPAKAPEVEGWSNNGVANVRVTADESIPQVFVVQRAMRNFCDPDGSDYETCASLAPQVGETMTWTDRKPTGYAMYRVKGFNANGESAWTYFEIEPEKLINGPAAPSFAGNMPGFYEETASVEITYPVQDAKIYYTTDGSTPTINSTLYTGAITLEDVCGKENDLVNVRPNPVEVTDSGYKWIQPTADQPNVNVIRARAFMPDGSASTNEIAGTWMVGPTANEHRLRVISIQTDRDNFFSDPTGILVPGDVYNTKGWPGGTVGSPNANYFQHGDDWERPVQIEIFDTNRTEMLAAPMGTRVRGNWSRAAAKKSLTCYFRKEYGVKNAKIKLFNDEKKMKFKRFIVRNGGNDWYKFGYRDAIGQSLFRGYVSTGTQGFEPGLLYINGEYWGLYNLRHCYSKHHFEEWNGGVGDDIDYVKMSPDDGNHFEVQEGDLCAMWNIMQYMITHTDDDGVMDDDEYAYVESQIDIADMIDYYIVNVFLGNNDWNGNNMGYWRNRRGDDQKWHFTVYDCDSAMSFNGDSYSSDHIQTALNANDTDESATRMVPGFFKRCFKNVGFRQRFANRYADLLNTALKAERATNVVAQVAETVRHELPRNIDRWLNIGSQDNWDSQLATVTKFFYRRQEKVFGHILSHCEGGALANITLDACEGNGKVKLNTIESGKEFKLPFTGTYFDNIPVTLTATPDSGSEFAGWKIDGELVLTEPTVELMPTDGVTVQAVFSSAGANPQQALRLVEIYGSTNTDIDPDGDTGEFVVITNTSDKAVGLNGMTLESFNRKKSETTLQVVLAGGEIPANGGIKLTKDEYWPSAKISNGKIKMTIADSDGIEIQSATTEFSGDADGKGASLLATTLDNPCDVWVPGPIHDVPPTPPPTPGEDVVLEGALTNDVVITSASNVSVTLNNVTSKDYTLTLTGGGTFTLFYPEGTTNEFTMGNNKPAIVATNTTDLIITGPGAGVFTSTKKIGGCGVLAANNLTVADGTTTVTFDKDKPDTACVFLTGNYWQTNGTMNVVMPQVNTTNEFNGVLLFNKNTYAKIDGGAFNATVGGTKSNAIKLKGSCNGHFNGGTVTASLIGVQARVTNGGTQDFTGGDYVVTMPGDYASLTNARVFKVDKALTVSGGTFDVNVPSEGSEAFATDKTMAVSGGTFRVLTGNDCVSAETGFTMTGGTFYGTSTGNDVIDSNKNIDISGGLVIAYTTAVEEDGYGSLGLDVNIGYTLTISGGTVVALGGPNAKWPDGCDFRQSGYTNVNLDATAYSGKYLVLDGEFAKTTVKLPEIPEPTFALLVSAPGLAGPATPTDVEPAGTRVAEGIPAWIEPKHNQRFVRFAKIYGNTADGVGGDTGEYIVLTNVSNEATVYLSGLNVNVQKYDDWVAKKSSKCNFTLTSETLAPGASIQLEQAAYWSGSKQKITNGDLYIALTDADGKTVQSGETSNNFYPECDGNGASLVAKTFDTTIAMTTDDWEPSFRWYYFTTDGETSTITGFGPTRQVETTLTLPRELGKVPVSLVASNAFADCALTTLKVTLTNETLKVMKTEGAAIATYDMSESAGELVLGYALGSALNVSGNVVVGPSTATLAFDLGEGVSQEINGTTDDVAKQYGIVVYSGTLNFTKSGGDTSFRGRTVIADGENAVVRLGTGDATGYSHPGTLIALRNGGRMDVSKRDTLCTPIELSDGMVKLLAGCAGDSGRGLDLYNANGNIWTISGDSTLVVDPAIGTGDGRKMLIRKGDWNIDVSADSLFTVEPSIVAQSGASTVGKILKTGAGTLYLAATDNTYATATEIVAGTLKLAQSSLAGSLAMNAGTTLMLNYEGEIVEGAEVFSAASIVADGVTFIVNGKPLPEGLTLNAENGTLVVGKPKATEALNPSAVRDGATIKVSCNEGAENAANAYDGNASTYFDPGDTANAKGNSWAGIEFTNGVIVTRIAFACCSGKMYRMVGGVFQGANEPDFSDAETMCVVDACPAETADVTLAEAKGPYKYLRFIGMHGGNVAEITYYGLATSGTEKPTAAPDITGESVDGVAHLTLTADATIPQVYVVQRAMRNFCEDDTDYETFLTLTPRPGETVDWTDSEPTPYAMYRAKGLNANGSGEWKYFELEPEKLIAGAAAPKFGGDKPGFYASNAVVEISYDDPNANIYYTLDGSTPTTNSTLYTEAITLYDVCANTNNLANIPTNPSELWGNNKYGWKQPTADQPDVNVIRARAFTEDGAGSTNEIAGTWMIGPTVGDHLTNGLRVVSIVTDKDNFFSDPTGIMVPGDVYNEKGWPGGQVGKPNANYFQKGIEWERPVFVDMFESDGTEMFSAKMGARTHGNVSRAIAKKTLNFYLRKEYEQKNLKKVKLFKDDPDHNKFKRFALRNGGNDWQTLNMRDAFGQSVFRGEGIDAKTDTQGYEPVVMYINGEYWGLYNLRHAYSKHYFEDWHGAPEDDVDYIKMFPGEDGSKFEIQEGDGLAIRDIMQYMVTCTADGVMDDAEFAKVEEQVDIDSMIDYYIVRFFLANGDSMNGNNMSFWRSRSGADTKWHFAIYDCDEALSSSGMDMFYQAINRSQDTNDSGSFYEPCFFKRCYMNAGFKQRFANRYADLLNTALKSDRTTNLFAKAVAKVTPEMDRTVARWLNMGSVQTWQNNQTTVRNFFINRPASEFSHIKSYCNGGNYANITLDACEGNGKVLINTIESGKHFDLPFTGKYFTNIPVTLTAKPAKGYQFTGWKSGDEIVSTDISYTFNPADGLTVQAVFEESEGNPQQALRLVEIYGSTNIEIDPKGDTGEFVVITNTTDKAIELTGLNFTSAKDDGSSAPKVNITLTTGVVEARGSLRINQSDWSSAGWVKITNGAVRNFLTDSDGAVIQESSFEFTGEADGAGASMLAKNLDNPCSAWEPGPIHDVPPTPPPTPETDVITGEITNAATYAEAAYTISNATLKAALTFSNPNGVTLTLVDDSTGDKKGTIYSEGPLTIKGDGTLALSGETALMDVGGLNVNGGTLNLTASYKKKIRTVVMRGSYYQDAGTVNLDVTGTATDKNALGFVWEDRTNAVYTATLTDNAVFNATMASPKKSDAFRSENSGVVVSIGGDAVVTASFSGASGEVVETDADIEIKGGSKVNVTSTAVGGKVFEAAGKITVKKATIDIVATGADTEAFSAGDTISIENKNAVLRIKSTDDCFSAQTNIVVSAGTVYGHSVSNDVFDSNGAMTISGGTVVAYTLAYDEAAGKGHTAFDTECYPDNGLDHTFAISGGTVIGIGGKNGAWPTNCVFAQGIHTNMSCAAAEWTGKYLVAKGSTAELDVTAAALLPEIDDAFVMLVSMPGLAGEPTASADEPAGKQVAEDVPLWIDQVAKTFQENLRFYEIYGNTTEGSGKSAGDVGEYFVLTNISAKTVSLKGLKINIGKKSDCDEQGPDAAKVKLVLTEDTVEPYGSVKFKQSDYSKETGWDKITNGDLYLLIRDAADTQVQKGYTSNKLYPQCDGKGASLIAKTFGVTIESTKADWKPSYWMPTLFLIK